MPHMRPSTIKLSDLRWETTSSYNVGMDLGLFNDKLSLVFDWYSQTTNDMLMPNVRIPSNSGYPTIA